MPEEYRELLTRLLTIQADCEIGGPHIYVDHWTLRAPTVDDQWRGGRDASGGGAPRRQMPRPLEPLDGGLPHNPRTARRQREGGAGQGGHPARARLPGIR